MYKAFQWHRLYMLYFLLQCFAPKQWVKSQMNFSWMLNLTDCKDKLILAPWTKKSLVKIARLFKNLALASFPPFSWTEIEKNGLGGNKSILLLKYCSGSACKLGLCIKWALINLADLRNHSFLKFKLMRQGKIFISFYRASMLMNSGEALNVSHCAG